MANDATGTKTDADIDVSVDVFRLPGLVRTHENGLSVGNQERRRQFVRRGRLHRVASKLLGRCTTTTGAPTVLQSRRHSTPIAIVEEESNAVQPDGHEITLTKPSRRKSLLSRARSLRGVKSLSDLKLVARKRERGKGRREILDQAGRTSECAVVRVRSVHSATSAPLYLFREAE
ncbi:hypothetical protein E4T48_04153 [Aureobasidium sp. EXF-10727]|nr:hypothetical protein E4T48_04153 [Aureobasidium sp. EXF-10727]